MANRQKLVDRQPCCSGFPQGAFRLFLILGLLAFQTGFAQVANTGLMDTTGGERVENLTISGYLDTYYGYFSHVGGEKSLPFFVSHNRHNEVNINLAYVDLRYKKGRIRSRIVPGFGSYMRSNYASEPEGFRYLLEANAGYKLSPSKEIWVDMGLLSSPFSNESPISRDQLVFSRSLAPEYVPYYLSGIRLTVPLGKKWLWYGYLVNGWQQMQDVNPAKSFVSQLEFRPDSFHLFTWNVYAGSEQNLRPGFGTRLFSDFYWIYKGKGPWSFSSCAYLGYQETKAAGKTDGHFWGQANVVARYRLRERHHLAARLEYFHDPQATVFYAWDGSELNRFRAGSLSLGWDCTLSKEAVFRTEVRHFQSPDPLFPENDKTLSRSATWAVCGVTISF